MRRILVAIATLLPTLALAQSPPPAPNIVTHVQTTSELASVCDPTWSDVPRLEAIAYCQGFITSAGQYHTLMHPKGGRPPLFCLPAQAPTIAQSGLAFASWVRLNPSYSSEPALDGFLRWAQATYPCAAPAPVRGATKPAR